MSSARRGVAASAISGLRWNYAGTVFSVSLSFLMSAVLARLLGPRPFGQVVIATMIFGFVSMFVNGGFSQALIQQTDLPEQQIRRTFTFQVTLGMTITGLVVALAPFLSRMFRDPSSAPVIRVMALMITFQALGLVSAALLRRSMRFKAVQFANISGYLVGYVFVGLPLALRGAGVWSLVFAYLSQAVTTSLLLYLASRHAVLPSFHLPDRRITHFGSAVIGSNLVNWGHSNFDNLASSRLGPFSLGLYGRACNLAYQPVTAVANMVQSVLLSASAKVQDRPEILRKVVLSMLAIMFGLIGPAYLTLAFIPDTVIVGLYGTKWQESVPLMVPMALAMPFWGGMSLLGPVLAGVGKPQLEFWPQAISCGFAAVAFFTASHYSLLYIAWALFAVSFIRLAAIATFTFRELRISWKQASALIGVRLSLSTIFGIVVWAADHALRMTRFSVGGRLGADAALAAMLLMVLVWGMPHLVFGKLAVAFLLEYAPHLPGRYVRQLQLRSTGMVASAAVDNISAS